MADVRDEAVDRLVTSRGGADAVVARAATGTLDTEPVRVEGISREASTGGCTET